MLCRTLAAIVLASLFPTLTYAESIQLTNQLLRTGPLEALENTPIYANSGIVFTVGAVDNLGFDVTDRLQSALQAADNKGGIIKSNWYTETSFEEWGDRLILTKSTHFYMLDGQVFNTSYFGGEGFETDPAVTVDPNPLPDIMPLVQDFIDAGGHLNLYPEAAVAGAIGATELADELQMDRGPVTVTETIEFSRVLFSLDQLEVAKTIDILETDPVGGAVLEFPMLAALPGEKHTSYESGETFEEQPSGVATYSQEMLNGFTIGNEWSKSITYDRRWFYAKAVAFAGFGLGVRIPWTAEVEVSPKVIYETEPDRTEYDASISVETLDADTDFYRRVGVPAGKRFDGKELPLQAGAGIGLKVKVLNTWYLDRWKDNPLVGRSVNMSEHFKPPLGNSLTIPTAPQMFENTGLAYLTGLAGIGGDFRAVFGVNGDAIELEVKPHNSWNYSASGYSSGARKIRLTNENSPISLSFAVNDSSAGANQSSYNYGPIYDDASYETSLDITPEARIRGTIYLSNLWGALSDINITSAWHSLFTATFDLPSLGPHDGTNTKLRAVEANERRLNQVSKTPTEREFATDGYGIWNFKITNLGSKNGQVVEYLPEGFELVTGSLEGLGEYNASERKIVWELKEDSFPEALTYKVSSLNPTAIPKPNGLIQIDGETVTALNDTRFGSLAEAEAELNQFELAKRPTLDEVRDLRSGSVLLDVSGETASLRFKVQQSENLQDWEDVDETVLDLPKNTPVKFYRYVPVENP